MGHTLYEWSTSLRELSTLTVSPPPYLCWNVTQWNRQTAMTHRGSSIIRVAFDMGQHTTWLWKAASSPIHQHPLSSWQQNTDSEFTLRWKCLSNIMLHGEVLQSEHGRRPSFFILVAASSERSLPQHEVRWGWSSRPYVTGQKKLSDGCSTNR